jgi:hypothetical protein
MKRNVPFLIFAFALGSSVFLFTRVFADPYLNTISYKKIKDFPKSANPIVGNDDVSNQIPTGTIVVYKTRKGKFGAFHVTTYGYNLTLSWITYNADSSVYSKGDGLVIHGTWTADLDSGKEANSTASGDFWWEQATSVQRNIVPESGATFAVYDHVIATGLPTVSLSSKMVLSPNPASDHISISGDSAGNWESLHIYDAQGRDVLQLDQFSPSISVEYLPSGHYEAVIEKQGVRVVKSFLKQ